MKERKKFLLITLTLIFSIFFTGCSENSVKRTSHGYVIEPGVQCTINASNVQFSYTIIENNETQAKLNNMETEAKKLVSEWWNNPSTFKEPVDIFAIDITGTSTSVAPRGFQDEGYIFIDLSKPDAFTTLVHEYIHVQNPKAFTYSDGTGHEILEMVVETITSHLIGEQNLGVPTNNYILFNNSPALNQYFDHLQTAYKTFLSAEETFSFYGADAKNVIMLIDAYDRLPEVFTNQNALEDFSIQAFGLNLEELFEVYKKFQ